MREHSVIDVKLYFFNKVHEVHKMREGGHVTLALTSFLSLFDKVCFAFISKLVDVLSLIFAYNVYIGSVNSC